jgi:tRNA dimethylallyltransferase
MDVLRVIVGPTAAGKSAAGLWLAERHAGAIISADSRQLYRGFDVGTAKPSAGERARVPHHGIDVAAPTERYSAARFGFEARAWIAECRDGGREPIVVGGTGFYVRALVEPLAAAPELGAALDVGRRARLASYLERLPLEELRRWVTHLDPARAPLGRTQLLRAIETVLLTGRRVSELQAQPPAGAPLPARYLVVDPGRAVLRARIERRLDAMLAQGWLDEVRRLMELVPPDAPAWTGTGYDVLRRHLAGELSLGAAREAVLVATRQYAKRQRTWFRHQLAGRDVTWLDPLAPDAEARLEAWWHATTPARLRATPAGGEEEA